VRKPITSARSENDERKHWEVEAACERILHDVSEKIATLALNHPGGLCLLR
jgi:hypothetical protein